jgi:UDP:flavonoid glycosyltransferase YjiC (YdhE family)
LPALYGLSEQVLAKPQDWTSDACFSGFWVDPESAPDLDREVVDFLEAGTSPLVITFGSMPVSLRFDLESSLYRALDALPDLRLVVVRGWGLEGLKSTADGRLLVVDQVPYDRLFPRALAVIHHGGVGTTAACLLSGTPFWICPVLYPIGDQWFWGKRAEALGVALPPVPLKKLSEKGFLKGVAALVGASPQEAMDAARRKECARAFNRSCLRKRDCSPRWSGWRVDELSEVEESDSVDLRSPLLAPKVQSVLGPPGWIFGVQPPINRPPDEVFRGTVSRFGSRNYS